MISVTYNSKFYIQRNNPEQNRNKNIADRVISQLSYHF